MSNNPSPLKTLIYTDGACSGNPGPGGWAAILLKPDQTVQELGGHVPHTTNNRMEMIAAIEGIQAAPTAQIELLTDSNYLIQGMTLWIKNWKKKGWRTSQGKAVANEDLWKILTALCQNKTLQWKYVRGHSGNPGNERADTIAVAFSLQQKISLFNGPTSQAETHFS